ncbi:universal stress protein [Arthrobacter sp. PAMC25564]|uniref:universal stress protein n=1 Tax=Arthrobacter sp. PAMC25564 TaxID=2565366 RepID=UPI0010A2671F|nr:universal stress protein [Arthrobacter sp. PAMC25564]QCB97088.1 universal stress protein [Arthrobacter sp. PAMC25564]
MSSSNGFRIVVGVDGSAQSQAALDWGVQEARLRQGQVLALATWHLPYVADAAGQAWDYAAFEQDVQAVLAEELQRVADPAVQITGQVVEGNPAAALVEASRDADLVIVGSRGRGGFAGLLLGSVSSNLAHHAHCPVLIIRTGSAAD